MTSYVKPENDPKAPLHDSVNEELAVYSAAPESLEDELEFVRKVLREDWEKMEPSLRYLADR